MTDPHRRVSAAADADDVGRYPLLKHDMRQIHILVSEARFDLEHKAMEVYGQTDCADLALSKPIVQNVINIADADAGLARRVLD